MISGPDESEEPTAPDLAIDEPVIGDTLRDALLERR